jgi:alkylation response protein AidB-like acyl-CoA dehydrogenase
MSFDLDQDEQALQDGIRAWCQGRAPMARVRASADAGGVDRELVAELAEQGVLALTVPEDRGGLGLTTTHAAVVFTELGRALVPGPIVATHLAAAHLDAAADGSMLVTQAESGTRTVLHPRADAVVVVGDDGLWLHDLVAGHDTEPFDPMTGVAGAAAIGQRREQLGDTDATVRWRRRRTLLSSAQALGVALGSLELATEYARQREQFGRAIGSFQAIKHLCADALTRAEVARAAVYAAACHLDGKVPDPSDDATEQTLAAAALLAPEAALANAKACIQVHGGMGFTWEVDAHLYLKRATVLGGVIGASHTHAERLASTM